MRKLFVNIPLAERFAEKWLPEPNSGCWLWMGQLSRFGYAMIHLAGNRAHSVRERAHRTSWSLYRGPVPQGMHVLHKCDTRCCVNPDHLFLGTNADNVRDRVKKDRSARLAGERGGMSKLTDDDVIEIRRLYAEGEHTQRQLARAFGVTQPTVKELLNRETWRHLP